MTKPNLEFARPSRMKIFACYMYEGMLLLAVIFVTSYAFDSLTQRTEVEKYFWISQALLFIAIGLYFVLSWRAKGQTLPMKTWNIGVKTFNSQKPSTGRLIIRYISAWIIPLIGAFVVDQVSKMLGWASVTVFVFFTPFLNFVYSWLDPKGLFLQDRLSGTYLTLVK
ncbi:RDD family protein [Taylorella asinigenitalis]|uniref:RDD family protein n=1 Tax=Taylorella asinigenitalis TaxID=84590 RepID=UPI00048C5427|nr:RDD family protein [Taylorella asinigenitalis]